MPIASGRRHTRTTRTGIEGIGTAAIEGIAEAGGEVIVDGGLEEGAGALGEGAGAAEGEAGAAEEGASEAGAEEGEGCNESCFVAGTMVLTSDGLQPIESILVGRRVATDCGTANSVDGKTPAVDSEHTDVDSNSWSMVTIVAGDWFVQSLQPPSEIAAEQEVVGGAIPLANVVDLKEMGVPAGLVGTVKSIDHCPEIEGGSGRVVLTTVRHLNDFLYRITLSDRTGNTDTLGVTGYHKFYTEDRGWVVASELERGEPVRTATGEATVAELVRDPGAFVVYNLTVEGDHVYYVGDLEALVHNDCPDGEDKGSGNYRTHHESGKVYDGKGPKARSNFSGKRIAREYDDPHVATEWEYSPNDREAFKGEARRIAEDGGVESPHNYNKINSPGKRILEEDGEI